MSCRMMSAVLVALITAYALGAQGRGEKETSPHVGALELVFKSQQKQIRAADEENWWHDTKERAWTVKRPFAPGGIDSTHLFEVRYRIADKEVAGWLVDTRKGTVQQRVAAKGKGL